MMPYCCWKKECCGRDECFIMEMEEEKLQHLRGDVALLFGLVQ